jgi:NADH:ubiquinone oxidoreductase subunit 5 (subunit L)/multisubunit Na+/H+ antiporter MnhA subunit
MIEIKYLLPALALIPLIGLLIVSVLPGKKEKYLAGVSTFTLALHFWGHLLFLFLWILGGSNTLNIKEISFYSTSHYSFFLDLHYDLLSASFLSIGSLVTLIVVRYSRYYMHKESGFKRFFVTLLFFYLAYSITVLSGNFETLFLGWEMLGISSFLLIAFYRHRTTAARNAMKVYSVYRIGDVGLLLAMWASHHLWHENITFLKLSNLDLVHSTISAHSSQGVFIAFCLLVAAAAKSAQLPYSSWLPRAMEGPTPSSAIFYGSLSVHFGVFLLFRTYPLWEEQFSVRFLIGLCGAITAIWAYLMSRVQSSIKTQIAYSAMAHIGLMFIELSFGWHYLVLIHFTCNAFLRCYQLLVSPSVVAFTIRQKLYGIGNTDSASKLIHFSLYRMIYALSLREWSADKVLNSFVFWPFRRVGLFFTSLTKQRLFIVFVIWLIIFFVTLAPSTFDFIRISSLFPVFCVFTGWLLVARAYAEKHNPYISLLAIVAAFLWISHGLIENSHYDIHDNIIMLSGILLGGVAAFILLFSMGIYFNSKYLLTRYNGFISYYPVTGLLFLFSMLCIIGFPVSPTFIGIDLVFSHINSDQYIMAFLFSSAYVMIGISGLRIYTHIFLGKSKIICVK